MKTLPRVVLAFMTLVGPMSIAGVRPSDARTASAVESTDGRGATAENDSTRVGPSATELEQRVRALESELVGIRMQEQEHFELPAAWNVSTEGP